MLGWFLFHIPSLNEVDEVGVGAVGLKPTPATQ